MPAQGISTCFILSSLGVVVFFSQGYYLNYVPIPKWASQLD